MYQNGGVTGDMAAGPPGMVQMSPFVDQNGLLDGMDVNMLSMDLDLGAMGPDHDAPTQSYNTPIAAQPPHSQSTPADSNDAFAVQPTVSNSYSMSGIGAGPLPTGFGMPSQNPSGSTLTEFTKRRNWSQRVIEELRDLLHILTPDGRIVYVSPSCKTLTGWEPQQLVGRVVTDFIHSDDSGIFIREFNESIASQNALRFFYRFRKADGAYVIFESHGHGHFDQPAPGFAGSSAFAYCRGFFMMARPYPIKNTSLLDSFLEHKIENERLTKRVAELKREEQEEQEAQERHWMKKQEGHSSVTPSVTDAAKTGNETPMSNNGMPPPPRPGVSNAALTRQNLDEVLAASKPDSINDKMARYEGATHIDTIEMLTGLRYRDGERSQGISTGDTSPALIRGDAGIAILVDKENRGSSDKKKKLKVADEYVCTDCGTLDSPEWRKGPNGPKTLCNACGLRWAKKEKKRQSMTANGSQQPPSLPMGTSSGSG
ncbi:PAS domain-containing protein [Lasiodiplodia theobromae]|uniref:Cutinase gene palindrome-binding protein n=1 Tax=Lasiodiplodia theobromae TaxID=45133 RepID=A0A5N5DSI6_9PEZI|nr:White collar-2 protein [Lasiodiplodia theobromae]KAB2580727.1 Cutinase gene palindrome-binding protein [Lasiodiplodia theobromae]KAF4539709.1 White collar-2 protein [Lasiodiplodia theobromae]KAF9635755.1 PAS domain-containing protein [Lasiodiplodia theobromae]